MGSGYVRSTAKGRGFIGIGGRAFGRGAGSMAAFLLLLVSQLTGFATPSRKSWRMQYRDRSTQDV